MKRLADELYAYLRSGDDHTPDPHDYGLEIDLGAPEHNFLAIYIAACLGRKYTMSEKTDRPTPEGSAEIAGLKRKNSELMSTLYDSVAQGIEHEEQIEQLKGESPIPGAWWKDCPKVAQKAMERMFAINTQLTEQIKAKDAAMKAVIGWLHQDAKTARETLEQALKG